MKITFISSSFIFPGNIEWKKIKHNLFFEDFGNYKIINKKKTNDFLICILFIKDFEGNQKEKIVNIKPIIDLLENRINHEKSGTLVMVSSYNSNNLIEVDGNINSDDKVKNLLLDKFKMFKKKNKNFFFPI